MIWSDMQAAVKDAKNTVSRADQFVGEMAEIIAGRLRKSGAYPSTLEKLKRELRDYNIHTNSWRSRK